jgi:hypothetical protein
MLTILNNGSYTLSNTWFFPTDFLVTLLVQSPKNKCYGSYAIGNLQFIEQLVVELSRLASWLFVKYMNYV